MSEVINNFENIQEKTINEISKELADYFIQKKQTEKNGEYIGPVDKIDKLSFASNIKNNLMTNETAIQEYVEMLKKDLINLEFIRQNFYHIGNIMTLAIKLQELNPILKISIKQLIIFFLNLWIFY